MSKKDATVLASRTLALLLVVWALTDVSYLPGSLHSYLRYVDQGSVFSTGGEYWRHSHLISLGFLITRIVAYALAARWLFKGGPEVEQLFSPSTPEESAAKD